MSNKNKFVMSVQAKIILVAIVLITLILGTYAVVDIYRKQSISDDELRELADVTAKKLTANLKIPLWNLDTELVSDSVEAEMLTKDIEAIFVLDSENNQLVVGKQRQSSWSVSSAVKGDIDNFDGRLKSQSFVTYKNDNIGQVVVYVTKQFKRSALIQSVLGLVLTLIVLDITIFIVLVMVISNVLRKPIQQLSDAANQISRGDFNVEIETGRQDEIGVVANSVDRMRVSLKMSIDRLRKLSKQHKVLISKMDGK